MSSKVYRSYEWEPDPTDQDEQDIRTLELAWDRAVERGDTLSLRGMMSEEYVTINVNGETADRSQVLKCVSRQGRVLFPTVRDVDDIRVYGDTAIVSGRVTWDSRDCGPESGTKSVCRRSRYVKVYVRCRNGWQAVIAQATRVDDASATEGRVAYLRC